MQSGSVTWCVYTPGMSNIKVKMHSYCKHLQKPCLWNLILASRFHSSNTDFFDFVFFFLASVIRLIKVQESCEVLVFINILNALKLASVTVSKLCFG